MAMIPGLTYEPSVLTEEQEFSLLAELDGVDEKEGREGSQWVPLTDAPNSRRVQHYGFRYDYKRRTVSEPTHAIPAAWREIFQGDAPWNQVIVNEYRAGQGISAHVDSLAYGEVIQCYTLGSGATMRFTHCTTGERREVYVGARSVYRMEGEARYQWKHEMVGRKSDTVEGVKRVRGRRISITLRWVPVPAVPAP